MAEVPTMPWGVRFQNVEQHEAFAWGAETIRAAITDALDPVGHVNKHHDLERFRVSDFLVRTQPLTESVEWYEEVYLYLSYGGWNEEGKPELGTHTYGTERPEIEIDLREAEADAVRFVETALEHLLPIVGGEWVDARIIKLDTSTAPPRDALLARDHVRYAPHVKSA